MHNSPRTVRIAGTAHLAEVPAEATTRLDATTTVLAEVLAEVTTALEEVTTVLEAVTTVLEAVTTVLEASDDFYDNTHVVEGVCYINNIHMTL
jgi:hypothetical protein